MKLPDTVINERAGYALVQILQNMLTFIQAEPGKRDGFSRMPTLREGHQHRKCRLLPHVSDLSTPLFANTALTMLKAVYARFDFDAQLMDAVCGRSTSSDMNDARVCAMIKFQTNKSIETPNWWSIDQKYKVEKNALDESVLSEVLQWTVHEKDPFSVYVAALPFFRRTAAQPEAAESFNVADLLVEHVLF